MKFRGSVLKQGWRLCPFVLLEPLVVMEVSGAQAEGGRIVEEEEEAPFLLAWMANKHEKGNGEMCK